MPRLDQRGSSALLYVVAVVLIGGFMYWLYMQSQAIEQNVQPSMQQQGSASAEGGQPPLSLNELASDIQAAIGRRAAFDSVDVGTGLGRGVFVLQLDSVRVFPVLKNPTLIQRGEQLYGGDQITVAGQVYTYTDSIGRTWVERGAVDESQASSLLNASTTNAFLLADSLVLH